MPNSPSRSVVLRATLASEAGVVLGTNRLACCGGSFCIVLFLLIGGLFFTGCSDSRREMPNDLSDARQAMLKKDFLEAEKNYERYLRRNPQGENRWEVWNELVKLSLNVRNDRKDAIELLEAMLLEYDSDAEKMRQARGMLAEQYRLGRNYERALILWTAVAEDAGAPNNERGEAYRNLARVYMRRLEFELAKAALEHCRTLDVNETLRGQCLYDLAQIFMCTDNMNKGIEQFRAVLALKDIPASLRTLTVFMLADALDQAGQDTESLSLFKSIRSLYPNSLVVEKRIAFLLKKKKVGQKNTRR